VSFDRSPIRFVVARRAGDVVEYLQRDGGFGPLTDHVVQAHLVTRRDLTQTFMEQDSAENLVRAHQDKYSRAATVVPLQVVRLP
jgi:hypothetical protein